MCLKLWNACKTNIYGYFMVIFAILWYQVFGVITLIATVLDHPNPLLFFSLSTAISSIILGLMLSVSTLLRNPKVVLVSLITGVVKLIIGIISALVTDENQIVFSEFGHNWALVLILIMMQHGIYMFYKYLRTEKAMSSNRMLIGDAPEYD